MTVALSALSFAIASASPTLLLSFALFLEGPHRASPADDFLLAGYLVALSSSLRTVGFLIPTASSALWRRLALRRAVLISIALGLIAPIASLLVVAVGAAAIVRLFHVAPWLAVGVMHGLPGVVLGGAALVIAKASTARARKVG
jgi:hypothetical protein